MDSQRFGRDNELALVVASLVHPGLIVVSGPPGIGKSSLAVEAAAQRSPRTLRGGGLPTLGHVAGLSLARALGTPLPSDDLTLAVAVVRTAVGEDTLIVDDAQWADPWTMNVVVAAARWCRIVVTHRSEAGSGVRTRLQRASSRFLALGPLDGADAGRLVDAHRPGLDRTRRSRVIERGGGNPLALIRLAQDPSAEGLRPSVARTVADLTQPARTALAALGLVGRAVDPGLLGVGVGELASAGLVCLDGGLVEASPRVVAELAASMVSEPLRLELHQRLADLLPPDEAAYHLAAAGRIDDAVAGVRRAARESGTIGQRNRLLVLAAQLGGEHCREDQVLDAVAAALELGDGTAARNLLRRLPPPGDRVGVRRAVLASRVALADDDLDDARRWVGRAELAASDATGDERRQLVAAGLRTLLATDPVAAVARAQDLLPDELEDPTISVLVAMTYLVSGAPDWEYRCRRALDRARSADRWAEACHCALALADALIDRARPSDAVALASDLEAECRDRHLYSFELAFASVVLWGRLHVDGAVEEVVDRGHDLSSVALAAGTRARLGAIVALARCDGGDLAGARAALSAGSGPAGAGQSPWERALLTWTALEIAFLAGDHGEVLSAPIEERGQAGQLFAVLRDTTRAWSLWALDPAMVPTVLAPATVLPPAIVPPASDRHGATPTPVDPADAWEAVMVREHVRARWARGLAAAGDGDGGTAALLQLRVALTAADGYGLVLLGSQIRGSVRRFGGTPPPLAGGDHSELSARESQVLELVAQGLTSRQIAATLGISPETAVSHLDNAKRKLGARSRTEAAILARQAWPE